MRKCVSGERSNFDQLVQSLERDMYPVDQAWLDSTAMFSCQQVGSFRAERSRLSDPCERRKKAASVQDTPRPRESFGWPRSSTLIHQTRSSPYPSKTAGSAAHLDRSDTPAMPGMHAPLHRIAAAIAVVGVAWSECKCAERKSAPVVVEPVVETAAAETIGCEGSTAKSTAPNSG